MIPIFGDQLKRIPTAAISAIVIYLSYRIIDWKSLSVAITERKPDHFILITTILIGSFYSILGAILIGFVLASILFMYKMSIVVETMTEEGAVDDFIDNHKIEDSLLDDIRIINLNGPLFFWICRFFLWVISKFEPYQSNHYQFKRCPIYGRHWS